MIENEYTRFRERSGNANFRRSTLTWVSLLLLLVVYPGISVLFAGDPSELGQMLDQTLLLFTLIGTIFIQWLIFLLIFVTAYRERTGLRGLGLKPIRLVDFGWAAAFLLASNLILAALAWLLALVGLPMPGELAFLIPTDPVGRVVWVMVSFTAGFCEEIGFRGYLMTRLRILGKSKSWIIPTVASSLVFGVCHAYQGLPGLILLSVYGALFALLFIRTGRLWPCIIAHFFQDFSALFIPQ